MDNSDNIIVTGYSTDSSQSYNWDWCTIKYNLEGDTLWIRREDVGRDDRAYSAMIDRSTNDIIVAGGLGEYGAIVRYDGITGNECWRKYFSWTGLLIGTITDNNQNTYFASWCDPKLSGFGDFLTVKCDSFGDTLWTALYDGGFHDQTSGITIDKSGNVLVFGNSYDGYPDSQPTGQSDYLTIKYSSTTGVDDRNSNVLPQQFKLYPNYPNPFNPVTRIGYSINQASHVSLKIFNILGQEITMLVNELQYPGEKTVTFDATNLPGGMYFYRLTTGSRVEVRKMVLIK